MTTTVNNEHKNIKVPNLRFPEFQGEWEEYTLQDVVTFSNGKAHENCVNDDGDYILVNSKFVSTNGQVQKRVTSQLSPLHKSQFVMVMSDLPNGKALAKCFYVEEDNKYTLNQRVCSFTSNDGNVSRFLMYQINRNKYYLRFDDGINQTNLKKSEVLSCPVFIPIVREQEKIATLLCKIDERIATQNKIIDKLQSLIKGIRNDVFGKLRKSIGFNAMISDVLCYEQPQPYIVEDTEYTAGGTPVLTANKAFVLGYTSETDGIYDKGDCIIFDDFTLDCKYVDFPFKVKSSAIKILTAKNKELLRYTFEFLKYLDLSTDEHKRHYIAETQNQEFILPTTQIVRTIAHAFSTLSSRMQTIVKQRDMLELQKQYLLRQMFI